MAKDDAAERLRKNKADAEQAKIDRAAEGQPMVHRGPPITPLPPSPHPKCKCGSDTDPGAPGYYKCRNVVCVHHTSQFKHP